MRSLGCLLLLGVVLLGTLSFATAVCVDRITACYINPGLLASVQLEDKSIHFKVEGNGTSGTCSVRLTNVQSCTIEFSCSLFGGIDGQVTFYPSTPGKPYGSFGFGDQTCTLAVSNPGCFEGIKTCNASPNSNNNLFVATTAVSDKKGSIRINAVSGGLFASCMMNLDGLCISPSSCSLTGNIGSTVTATYFPPDSTRLFGSISFSTGQSCNFATPSVSPIAAGTVLRAKHSGKIIESNINNTVVQKSDTGSPNSLFFITPIGDGVYFLINLYPNPNLVLGVVGSGSNGAQIMTSQYNGGFNQHWKFVKQGVDAQGVPYYTIRTRYNNQCLDVPGSSTDDNVPLIIWPSNNGNNQFWTLS